MSDIVRFGVSMDRELVDLLDALTAAQNSPNRSETIRSLVRQQQIQSGAEDPQTEVTAVISLIFHYATTLARVPLDEYPSLRLASNLQMHLQRDIVIKILVVTGRSDEVRRWASRITGQKHVVGRINIAATDGIYAGLRGCPLPSPER